MVTPLLPSPSDFAQRLKAAGALGNGRDRLEALHLLAQHSLGFLETIQLNHAVTRSSASGDHAEGFSNIRLAMLGACTLDHLLPSIRVAGLRRRLLIDAFVGSFGQYRQELYEPPAALREFRPEIVLLSLTAREAIGDVAIDTPLAEVEQRLQATVASTRELWRHARAQFGASVVQQTFLDVSEPLFGDFDRFVPASPARLVARLNELIADAAQADGVMLLDVARASARDGLAAWFDTARWLQGKMEIAPQAASRFSDLLVRLIAAQRGLSRKCLVLDLDNTLWGGVIGDDGIDGIVLGEGSAAGEAHLALQRYAKALNERGIILAVCSKNDLATAEAAFQNHPEMVLKRSDIAVFVANWTDKAGNLRAIAQQLNIGLDSLVFVDDNPAERARVRESLPMVAVPELPSDPALYVRTVAAGGYFDSVSFTVEDRERATQYAANAERDSLREAVQSIDEYLRALEMTLTFGGVGSAELGRVTQLINKTNQFNPNTARVTAEALTRTIETAGSVALQFRLIDRFGDNGLISALILRPAEGEPDVLEIESWVMSCRVFGRQVEFESMTIAVEAARRLGIRAIRGFYVPSKKNGVVASLFESLGFTHLAHPAATAGASAWLLNVADYQPRPTFLERKTTTPS